MRFLLSMLLLLQSFKQPSFSFFLLSFPDFVSPLKLPSVVMTCRKQEHREPALLFFPSPFFFSPSFWYSLVQGAPIRNRIKQQNEVWLSLIGSWAVNPPRSSLGAQAPPYLPRPPRTPSPWTPGSPLPEGARPQPSLPH